MTACDLRLSRLVLPHDRTDGLQPLLKLGQQIGCQCRVEGGHSVSAVKCTHLHEGFFRSLITVVPASAVAMRVDVAGDH